MIVFYPMSAVITIFNSILLDPLHPRAMDDLELIASVPDVVRSVGVRRMGERERIHMDAADRFLAEFARLAKSAVVRAQAQAQVQTQAYTGQENGNGVLSGEMHYDGMEY